MRLNTEPRPVRWTDRTLSVLRTSRLEACEKELAGLGGFGLFDAETTDLDAERLFEESYYASEEKEPRLHSVEQMRMQVLSQFPAEMGLLSPEEYDLLLKMAIFGGEMPIYDWNDLPAALSLVRRMWCRAVPERGNWLRMPRQICVAALLMLTSEEMKTVREIAGQITETVDNTLYLTGMMPAAVVMNDIAFRMQGSLAADKPELYERMIRASFETVPDREGRLVLVHPGLADPRRLLWGGDKGGVGLNQESMEVLYGSMMDVEDPYYGQLLGQISGLTRAEIDAEETVEDLILLAKQGAPVPEMRDVLGTRLICLPTEEMVSTLSEMYDRVPRWFSLDMERLQ